ncbi:hypothetical protein [Agromyces salentinus]|uniref:Uncharacterized protein n=1 Tax=Agromyces salentinus TaxID=269421 RepID=A0ABN2MDQ6_9MICO|nr:hypothetical protein [Agromyces salentinus]
MTAPAARRPWLAFTLVGAVAVLTGVLSALVFGRPTLIAIVAVPVLLLLSVLWVFGRGLERSPERSSERSSEHSP